MMAGGGILIIVVAIAIVLIYAQISYLGLCFFGICDSEIEIIHVDYPKSVPTDQSFPVNFTINNSGENTVKNCILHFVTHPGCLLCDVSSSPFSLDSGKKVDLILESSGRGVGNGFLFEYEKEANMAAWVSCDDAESERIEFKTMLDAKALTEVIGDLITSENP